MYVFLMMAAFCINTMHAALLVFPYASDDMFGVITLLTIATCVGFASAFYITETVAHYMRWGR